MADCSLDPKQKDYIQSIAGAFLRKNQSLTGAFSKQK